LRHGQHDEGEREAQQERQQYRRREPEADQDELRLLDRHGEIERQPGEKAQPCDHKQGDGRPARGELLAVGAGELVSVWKRVFSFVALIFSRGRKKVSGFKTSDPEVAAERLKQRFRAVSCGIEWRGRWRDWSARLAIIVGAAAGFIALP
jgi:hypothetical protein